MIVDNILYDGHTLFTTVDNTCGRAWLTTAVVYTPSRIEGRIGPM